MTTHKEAYFSDKIDSPFAHPCPDGDFHVGVEISADDKRWRNVR